MLKISSGNNKLGSIPNVSLTPCIACSPDAPCKKSCYASKFLRRPNVKRAWSHNLQRARRNRAGYFADIAEFLKKKAPRFFRWHVAGDILDMDYFLAVCNIAERFPATKFLIFTKRHDIITSANVTIPGNLAVVASMWPGWGDMEKVRNFSKAWMQDGTETRIPANAIECPGNCESCGACWGMSRAKLDVVFHKH